MTNVAEFPSNRFSMKERALVVEWDWLARPYGIRAASVEFITGDGSFAPHDMVLVEAAKGETSHMIKREGPRAWQVADCPTGANRGEFPTLRDALASIRPVFRDHLGRPG